MSGNVWEWTSSSWPSEFEARVAWNASLRVARGGAFNVNPHSLRSAARYIRPPIDRHNSIGFRVAAAMRERAIVALLSERSIKSAAAKAGVNEWTLRRWLQDDADFKSDYEVARWATYSAAMSRVQALTSRALETLEDLLGARSSPNVRLGAARTIVEIGMHQHDSETILKRLDELESHQHRVNSGGRL